MTDSDKKNTKPGSPDKNITDSTSKESGRRKLLKAGGVVASSALVPEKWSKPVIDTVLLPAHAQTSAPLIGALLIVTEDGSSPTSPAVAMMAQPHSGLLDTFISPVYAQTSTPTSAPTTSPTASPTASPTPSPTAIGTPAPTGVTTAPTPTPVCPAVGQCVGVTPPNGTNQVQFSITNVGTAMLPMTGALTYEGVIAGITLSGFFTDQSFSNTQGTAIGGGCNGTYTAVLGGTCTPAS